MISPLLKTWFDYFRLVGPLRKVAESPMTNNMITMLPREDEARRPDFSGEGGLQIIEVTPWAFTAELDADFSGSGRFVCLSARAGPVRSCSFGEIYSEAANDGRVFATLAS